MYHCRVAIPRLLSPSPFLVAAVAPAAAAAAVVDVAPLVDLALVWPGTR